MFHDPMVNLFCADVAAGVRFYTEACGFREVFRTPQTGEPDHVELVLGERTEPGLRIALSTWPAAQTLIDPALRPGSPSAEVTLWCRDADAAFAHLVAHGAEPVRAVAPHGPNRNGYLRDPCGNLVGVVSRDG